MCGDSDECGPFSGMFSALNFRLGDGDISIKNKKIPIFEVMATVVFCSTV
jgi:hypothetical protein